jgi:hypothetical protein
MSSLSPQAGRSFYRNPLTLAVYNQPPRRSPSSSITMVGRLRYRGVWVELAERLFFKRVGLLQPKLPPETFREVWRSGHQRRAYYRNLLRQEQDRSGGTGKSWP